MDPSETTGLAPDDEDLVRSDATLVMHDPKTPERPKPGNQIDPDDGVVKDPSSPTAEPSTKPRRQRQRRAVRGNILDSQQKEQTTEDHEKSSNAPREPSTPTATSTNLPARRSERKKKRKELAEAPVTNAEDENKPPSDAPNRVPGYSEIYEQEEEVLESVTKPDYAEYKTIFNMEDKDHDIYAYVVNDPELLIKVLLGRHHKFEPRDLKEEGLYVGRDVGQAPWNISRLHQRLLREDSDLTKWFTPDHRLAIQPDPLKQIHTRPDQTYQPEADYLQTYRSRHEPPTLAINKVEKHYRLQVDLLDIEFHHHPSMNKEETLSIELISLHREFERRKKIDHMTFLNNKLKALRISHRNLKENIEVLPTSPIARLKASLRRPLSPSKKGIATIDVEERARMKRLKRLRELIRQTRQLRDAEELGQILLIQRIVRVWRELKEIRVQQGFITTNTKLSIKKIPTNKEEMMKAEEDDTWHEVMEMREDVEERNAMLIQDYANRCREMSERRYQRDQRVEQIEKEIQMLKKRQSEHLKKEHQRKSAKEESMNQFANRPELGEVDESAETHPTTAEAAAEEGFQRQRSRSFKAADQRMLRFQQSLRKLESEQGTTAQQQEAQDGGSRLRGGGGDRLASSQRKGSKRSGGIKEVEMSASPSTPIPDPQTTSERKQLALSPTSPAPSGTADDEPLVSRVTQEKENQGENVGADHQQTRRSKKTRPKRQTDENVESDPGTGVRPRQRSRSKSGGSVKKSRPKSSKDASGAIKDDDEIMTETRPRSQSQKSVRIKQPTGLEDQEPKSGLSTFALAQRESLKIDEPASQDPYEEKIRQKMSDLERQKQKDFPNPVYPMLEEFDEKKALDDIHERNRNMKWRPGDPYLDFIITPSITATPSNELPQYEAVRFEERAKRHIFAKLIVNGKSVCKSASKSLENIHRVSFLETFELEVLRWPEISLQIYEEGLVLPELISEVFISLPPGESMDESPELYQFSSNTLYQPTYELMQKLTSISGVFGVRARWIPIPKDLGDKGVATDVDVLEIVPPLPRGPSRSYSQNGRQGILDLKNLKEMLQAHDVDPNNPQFADIANLLKAGELDDANAEIFSTKRFEHYLKLPTDELNFKRLELLRKRAHKLIDPKPIPLYDEEIVFNVDDDITRSKHDRLRDLDAAAQIHKQIRPSEAMKNAKKPQKKLILSDIVNESALPDFPLALDALKKIFIRDRPLRPRRKERKVLNTHPEKCELLIQIQRGENLPARKKEDESLSSKARLTIPEEYKGHENDGPMDEDSAEVKDLQPYAEVTFQNKEYYTHTSNTCNPNWSEGFTIPIFMEDNDFSAQNLSQVTDKLVISIFDSAIVDVKGPLTDRSLIIKRRERRWIGKLVIPFSTIYENGRVEGTFRIETPPYLMGYELPESGLSYISVYMTLDPPLPQLDSLQDILSVEDPYLENWCHQWLSTIPHKSEVLVVGIDGLRLLVCRFIIEIEPPFIIDTADKALRFVSLIPFMEDSVAFTGQGDCWNISEHFLEMGHGDYEEHAVLLCNYLLHLGLEAFVVIGQAIPEGDTAYVMTRDKIGTAENMTTKVTFWNASAGMKYDQSDDKNALQKIRIIFNDKNVWGNLQKDKAPHLLDMNLDNPKSWSPLFTDKFPLPVLESVQITPLTHADSNKLCAAEETKSLEDILQSSFEDFRDQRLTRWDK
eukprot:TRINITY_DN3128_c0_g1_i10.p1 TRINITY_DN3128_c0_g1~~TRINITY_DN3128_c0_g1_i10.p1  ORF type:complete len:1686 (+),score=344.27 TRINITY_DN3128_c0_g1_i10:64-5121(+)